MDITKYIPNIFGQAAPSYLPGLLGAEETQNLQNRANVQGLLGAGLALAQGMSNIGPRRSAAENILGALAGGFGAAGGAYEQGVKNYMTQQQIAQTQLAQKQAKDRMASIEQIAKEDPALARLIMLDPSEGAKQYALKQQIKGFQPQGGTGEINTPEAYRALGQQYLAGGPNLKPLGEAYMKQADALELTSLGNLKGDESPEELDKRSTRAYALGSKDLAERLFGLAEQKRMYPDQVQAAPQAQDLAQREAMPQGQIITKSGEVGGYGKPNFDAGERYADEELNKKFQPLVVTEPRGRQGQLQLRIDNINRDIERISGMRPTAANRKEVKDLSDLKDKLQVDLNRLANMEYDFKSIKEGLPKKYHSEIDAIERLAQAGNLDSAGIRSSVEKFYSRLQEDEKGRKLEGNSATFAQMKFGTTDRAQLSGPQLAEILRFENAPTADQLAQLNRESLRLRSETGLQAAVPVGRESMIFAPRTQTPTTQTTAQPTTQTTTQPVTQTVTQPTTAPVRNVQPQVATQPSANVTEKQPTVQSPYFKVETSPLINKREIDLPIKDRQKLLEKQSGFIAANQYSLRNILDARNAAKALLANPAYIDALTSRTAKLFASDPAGIVLDQTTYTANEILKNIQGRSFINEIQEMRANSPTGGAVGNVAVAEMQTLSNIGAALQLGMNKAELIKQLQSYVDRSDRSLKTIPNQYSKVYGYNGEFDDIFASEVVKTTPTQNKLPKNVTVKKVP